jgi:hypothetical protein
LEQESDGDSWAFPIWEISANAARPVPWHPLTPLKPTGGLNGPPAITIRVPEDVIEDLKKVAPELGFSGYQPLIRAYVGQGLRKDLARWSGIRRRL